MGQRVRIYELAKTLNIQSTQLMAILRDLGVQCKSHSSTVDEETATLVKELLKEGEKAKMQATTPFTKSTREVTLSEFAKEYKIEPHAAVAYLLKKGEQASLNQRLSENQLELLRAWVEEKKSATLVPAENSLQAVTLMEAKEGLLSRAPIITVLGHVDHGKTTLLDAIRHTSVADKEKGGITQKIGASEVNFRNHRLIFIDTPGHEAFTAMRSHGAKVTDIAVLVVAADEGVMPQTVEALNHAKAAKVAIIVAVNKIDKEGANIERVKQQLADLGLVPEEWGGDTIYVPLSAKTGEGVDRLLEMISLLAEVLELKASAKGPAKGTVIEARMDKGLGPVADVIIHAGTLRIGDKIQIGAVSGKIRSMINAQGIRLKEAGPSSPVEIIGLDDVPLPGESFEVGKEYKPLQIAARKDVHDSKREQMAQLLKSGPQTEEVNKFFLVLRADSQGTLDAMQLAVKKVNVPEISIEILHAGVGAISESDVLLSSVSKASILGFNVRPSAMAKKAAEREKILIYTYDLIYELLTDLEKIVRGKLKPKWEERVFGKATIRQVFRVPKVGTIAGSYVLEGKVERNAKVRIIRDDIVVGESKVSSLKRFKEDVREVAAGFECGIGIERASDIKEGDVLEFIALEQS